MTDTVDAPVEEATTETTDTTTETTNEVVTETVTDEPSTAPEWLQSKYVTDGKSQDESIAEQAKAYNELSGKFGSFTGAPDEYTVALSEDLTKAGVELTNDDPMVVAAMEYAKENGMNQKGFDGMVNLYAMQQLADKTANDEYRADQMKALGNDAESRIKNITDWAGSKLDAETFDALTALTTNAESVKLFEQIIAMTRNASVDVDDAQNNSGLSAEDVSKMQFELDSNGNRRIQTDPAFKAQYEKASREVHGTGESRQMYG